MAFFTRFSRSGRKISGEVTTTRELRRFSCAHTVGCGFKTHFHSVDPVGSKCVVMGWSDEGDVNVCLPAGGYGVLGRADLERSGNWPEDMANEFDMLPMVSRFLPGEKPESGAK